MVFFLTVNLSLSEFCLEGLISSNFDFDTHCNQPKASLCPLLLAELPHSVALSLTLLYTR